VEQAKELRKENPLSNPNFSENNNVGDCSAELNPTKEAMRKLGLGLCYALSTTLLAPNFTVFYAASKTRLKRNGNPNELYSTFKY